MTTVPGRGATLRLELFIDETDFRVVDPDGYYWRATSREGGEVRAPCR